MKRAVGIELRRGVGICTFVPMLIALVFITLAHLRQWAGDWLGWAYYQRTSLIVFGPLVVAAAAWQGGRERRRGLVELLASTARGPLQRTTAALASPAAWALLAFGIVTAAMAAVTARNTSYGRPPALLTLGAVAAVLLFAVVGYAAGRASPWRITAPVLALATYVALGVGNYGPSYLSPGVQLFSGLEPAPWWPLASAGSFLLAALGVLLLLGHRSRWFAVPVLGLAWLVALPIANAGQDAFTPDVAGEALVCQDGSPQVCLTRRHDDQLPAVSAEVQRVLAGLDIPGPLNEQRFGVRSEETTLNTLYLGAAIDGSSDLEVVRQDAAQAAVRWRCAEGGPYSPDDDLGIATFELTDWILRRPEPPYAGLLAGRSEPQALALIREFRAAAERCDLPAARAALPVSP
ncbi:MAG: hypothetical protein ACR2K2_05350 [Mycobacteriales bacterium]